MHTVKIRNDSGKVIPTTYISIDGVPIRCRSVDYHADVDSVPEFTLGLAALTDIEVNDADIRFRFTPETVTDAVKVLRNALLTDKELWDGFIASISSAIDDMEKHKIGESVSPAEYILDRLVGVEAEGPFDRLKSLSEAIGKDRKYEQ